MEGKLLWEVVSVILTSLLTVIALLKVNMSSCVVLYPPQSPTMSGLVEPPPRWLRHPPLQRPLLAYGYDTTVHQSGRRDEQRDLYAASRHAKAPDFFFFQS